MKRRFSGLLAAGALGLLLPVVLTAQKTTTDIQTSVGKFPLEVTAEYLGMASGKTVVRLRLSSAQLS